MSRRSFYLSIFALTFIGLFLCYVFIPSKVEESLMLLNDNRHKQALERFTLMYKEGEGEKVSVLLPLIYLDLHFANEDHAIEMLESYVRKHPDDEEARKLLGKLYMDANRPYDYLFNLEELYRIAPSGEILRERQELYAQLGKIEERIEVLQRIVSQYEAAELEYTELAYLYASKGKIQEAVVVIDQLLTRFLITDLSTETINFIIGLYGNTGQYRKAGVIARRFVGPNTTDEQILEVLNTMYRPGLSTEGVKLLSTLPQKTQNKLAFRDARITLLIVNDELAEAFNLLKRRWATEQDKMSRYAEFIALASAIEQDNVLFNDYLTDEAIKSLSAELALTVAERAVARSDRKLAERLKRFIPNEVLVENPVLAFSIGLAAAEASEEEEKRFVSIVEKKVLSVKQLALMARIANAKGFSDLAKSFLNRIDSLREIDEERLYDLATLYLQLGMSEQGLKLVDGIRDNDPRTFLDDNAWMLLATKAGRYKEVLEQLDVQQEKDISVLRDLFYLAIQKKRYPFLLKLAEDMDETFHNEQSISYLAAAQMLNGQKKQALSNFAKARGEGGIQELYLTALTVSAENDKELEALLQEEMQRVKTIAVEEGSKKTVVLKLMELGYLLSNSGTPKAAAEIFQLAAEIDPGNQDAMNSFLFLWGDYLSDEQIKYIKEKAIAAEGKVKESWVRQFFDRGLFDQVLEVVSEKDLIGSEEIRTAYVESAVAARQPKLVRRGILIAMEQDLSTEMLVAFSWEAHYADLDDLAEILLERAWKKDPFNTEVLRAYATIHFFLGDMSRAKSILHTYFELAQDPDYLPYFVYAEILYQDFYRKEAKPFYERALEKILQQAVIETPQRITAGTILSRLEMYRESYTTFDVLLAENPDQPNVYADYSQVLMDRGMYLRAEAVLRVYRERRKSFTIEQFKEEDRVAWKFYRTAWVRLYKETNRIRNAFWLLATLNEELPGDPDVSSFSGDIYSGPGHWREAGWFMNQALWARPYNESFWKSRDIIMADHYHYVGFDWEDRETGENQKEKFYRLTAIYDLNPYTRLKFFGEQDQIDLAAYTNPLTDVTAPFTGSRLRTEVSVNHRMSLGKQVTGSFYVGEGGVYGLGLDYLKTFYIDRFNIGAEWNKPNWDFTQTTVNYGSRDQIYMGWWHRYTAYFEAVVRAELNRYNIKHLYNAGTSWGVEALASYQIPPYTDFIQALGRDAQVNIIYTYDKEKVTTQKELLDAADVPFIPLPNVDRDDHSVYVFFTKRFNPLFYIEAYGGWAMDAQQSMKIKPIGGWAVELLDYDGWHIRIDYSRSTSTQPGEESVDSYKVDLRYFY